MSGNDLVREVIVCDVPGISRLEWTIELTPEAVADGVSVVHVEASVFAAHWDSGWPDEPAVTLTLWSPKWNTRRYAKLSTSLSHVDEAKYPHKGLPLRWPVVDHRDGTGREYESWAAGHTAAYGLLKLLAERYVIRHGDRVRVVKGRKAPKGLYTLRQQGDGQYGPWAHLSDEKERDYKFISRENFVAAPDWENPPADLAKRVEALGIPRTAWLGILGILARGDEGDGFGWQVVADEIAGCDLGRYDGYSFAHGFRQVLRDGIELHHFGVRRSPEFLPKRPLDGGY